MIETQRHAGRCIYCAFRSQQLVRQARRLRSSAAAAAIAKANDDDHGPFFRRTKGWTSDTQSAKQPVSTGSIDGAGLVRRLLAGKNEGGPRIIKGGRPIAEQKANFNDVLHQRMRALREELKDAPVLQHIKSEQEAEDEKTSGFSKVWKSFAFQVLKSDDIDVIKPWEGKQAPEASRQTRADLREAYAKRGQNGLDERIKYAFYAHVTGSRFTPSDIRNQKALADLRYPNEWYPATRTISRTIHMHVGPTNSGKTYHALQRLEQAEKGVYAGPLRLLAHEVYTRMNAKGKPCGLVTGEERRIPENEDANADDIYLSACTVEMIPLNTTLDVAVIDEIQMIGNSERGWAWTQALLGVKAKEVHVCGEERTVPLIKELCASIGDKFEIHRYERLSPLKVAETSLDGDLRKLRKGDCIVSFSVIGIHALRKQIEQQTGRKVATVYGSLPPETRAQQARLFNDPNNDYDYLVASDAVGMGLNLAIKRVVFETSSKFDGIQRRSLAIADIKQIGGRAGRYRTAAQAAEKTTDTQDLAAAKGDSPAEVHGVKEEENVGIVTTLEAFDFPLVAAAMNSEPEPIKTAGIFPPGAVLERFASYFPPGTPFSYILVRLHELSQMHSRFHLCGLRDQIHIADLIEPVQDLTITDRNTLCSAPAGRNDEMFKALMPALAKCIAEQSGGHLCDIEALPLEILEAEVSASRDYLRSLEQLHKGLVTYLWLSYRFAGIFTTRALAFHVKGMVEEKIEDVLGKFSFTEQQRRKIAQKREKLLLQQMAEVGLEEEHIDTEERPERPVLEAGEAEETGVETADAEDGAQTDAAEDNVFENFMGEAEPQLSTTAGGDRFSGEEDIQLEDPVVDDATLAEAEEEKPGTSSFAQWRAQQIRGETQGSKEPEDEISSISGASTEAHLEAEVASDAELHERSPTASPTEADASDLTEPTTPEMELDEEPLPTQAESPQAGASQAPSDVRKTQHSSISQPSPGRFGGELPAKHLIDVDVNAAKVERDTVSRP